MIKKKLNLISDGAGWALDEEKQNVIKIFNCFGYKCENSRFGYKKKFYYLDRYKFLNDNFNRLNFLKNFIAVDYFHGSYDNKDFGQVLNEFTKVAKNSLVRVSTKKMYNYFTNEGFKKLIRIPIGLNDDFHNLKVHSKKDALRFKFNVPKDSFVIGSFQKDDVGWNNKGIPKLIKGPDIFIKIIKEIKKKIKNLHIVLTGPGRNYLKKELKISNIPYTHIFFDNYLQLKEIYNTLDVYLVSSRDEGGPKSILESMCCEIPIVSSRVGQAEDLIKHESNGFLYNTKQLDEATDIIYKIYRGYDLNNIKKEKLITAKENTISFQKKLWGEFLEYFNQ